MTPLRSAALAGLALLLGPLASAPAPLRAQPPAAAAARDALPAGCLARMGTLRFRQGSAILAVAVAPDGKTAASAGRDGTVRVWEIPTGRELRRFAVEPADGMGLAFSPDGKRLAASAVSVRLWDVASGRLLHQFAKVWGPVAFSRDGRRLAAATGDQRVQVWDAATGQEILRTAKHQREVTAVLFSADGKAVISAGGYEDRRIHFHDLAAGKEVRPPVTHENSIAALALSPDGRTLAVAGYFPALQLRDAGTGKILRTLDGGKTWCRGVTFTPDGRGVVSGGDDGTVRLWDAATGQERRRFEGLRDAVRGVALSADGKVLVAAGAGRVLRAWDVASGQTLGPTEGHAHRVTALHFSADSLTLTSAAPDRTVRTWDVHSGKELRRREGPADWTGAGYLSPDGKTLACACAGGMVRLWDVEVSLLKAMMRVDAALAFGPEGKRLATTGEGGSVRVWDVAALNPLHRLEYPASGSVAVAWSPDGRLLASSQTTRSAARLGAPPDHVVLWDAASGKQLHAIPVHLVLTSGPLAFSPDGRTVACLDGRRGIVRLWETATGKERRDFKFVTPPYRAQWGSYTWEDLVSALAISPDGRLLALGLERTIYLWDAVTGEELARFAGHEGKVAALAFAPDGRALASAGDDTTALLWDVAALPARRPINGKFSAEALEALWAELGRDTAGETIARLVQAPVQALPLLRARLKPVPRPQPAQIAFLLKHLQSPRFSEREGATRRLEEFAELVEPELSKRLEGRPQEEERRRLEQLLRRAHPQSAEQLRALRAVEVLEHVGSRPARDVLVALTRGAPQARLTRAAGDALRRLNSRPDRRPPLKADGPRVDAHGDPLPPGAVARLGTVRLRHAGQIDYLALSPDGALLVTGNYHPEAAIQVSQTATGKRVLYRPAPPNFNVMALAFTPDNRTLALVGQSISNDLARVYLWHVADGKEFASFRMPVNNAPFAWLAAFSPDGKTLAAGCDKIYLFNPAGGALRHTLPMGKTHATALAFAPDGKRLATVDEEGNLALWDPETGQQLTALKTDLAYTLAFGPDGKLLAAAGPGRPVRLWEVTRAPGTGRVRLVARKPPQGHEETATALAFAKDGRLLAAGAYGGGLWVWDTTAGKRLHFRRWPAAQARAAGFDPKGRPLVVGAAPYAKGLHVLDAASGRQLLDGAAHHDSVHKLAFAPDGKTLASLCGAGALHLWEAPGGKHLGRPDVPGGNVDEATFLADGGLLVAAEGALYRLDGPGANPVRLPLQRPRPGTPVLARDGSRLAVAQSVAADGKTPGIPKPWEPEKARWRISVWDVASGKELCALPVQQGAALRCELSPDGRFLATAGQEINLWDAATGRLMHRLPVGDLLLQGMAFTPRGRVLAVREGKAISLWEVASGQLIRRWSLPPGERLNFNHAFERELAFSADGRLLATDTYRGQVHFWDVGTGQQLHTLRGQGGPIAALAIAPDGKTLAAGNADTTVLLWDLAGVRPLSPATLRPLTSDDFVWLWEQMAAGRAAAAHPAAEALAAVGGPAAVWLRGRLKPAAPFDPKRLAQLVGELNDRRFETREKAMRELEGLGERAENALREGLQKPLPLEVERRARQVLQKLRQRAPEELRAVRAVDVLEQIGTAEARQILQTLAGGAAEARLTQEARASLKRLGGR